MSQLFAVVDVETTGFGKSDRVVEAAVVLLDPNNLNIVDEFETLINPLRDIGAIHVHGITASMVEAAPTFDELASYIAMLLGDNILVAHNLPFDARFLRQEFVRTSVEVDLGQGVDTLSLTGERLEAACQRFGISHHSQHRAVEDARVTAELFRIVGSEFGECRPVVASSTYTGFPRSLTRPSTVLEGTAHRATRLPTSVPLELAYLDTLDRFLADRFLDDEERSALDGFAEELGLSSSLRTQLHQDYLMVVIGAAQRDGVITETENSDLIALAASLGISESVIPEITEIVKPTSLDGMRVCFTGSGSIKGQPMERKDLEALAAARGLQPVASVTKKGCDLVIAADPASASGKAKKARDWGIPVISIEEFLAQTRGS